MITFIDKQISNNGIQCPLNSLNIIRLLQVVITPSVTTLLRGENDSKQSMNFRLSLKQQGTNLFDEKFFLIACGLLCHLTEFFSELLGIKDLPHCSYQDPIPMLVCEITQPGNGG